MKPDPTAASPMEVQEYLFSTTSADFAARLEREKHNVFDTSKMRDHLRGGFRLHRFFVMNWLLTNGVKIPVELMSDQAHPEVGQQYPDKQTT